MLIVDDDQDARDTLAILLTMSGHFTWTARNGREALELARTVHPDVVFLDICMPGEDGYSVCERIRQIAGGQALKVYALTALNGAEHDRRCVEAGFTAQLLKPLEPSALSRFV